MQRSVVWGAGVAVLAVAGFITLRSTTTRQAGRAVDAGIAQLLTRLPPGYAVRHGATDTNPLTSSLTLHDVVVTRDGATLITLTELTVSGVDSAALGDVFDPARYPDGHPAWSARRLLVADASARGLHLTVPGLDATQRSWSLHRLSGRPFAMPPTPENRRKPEFQADAALAFSLDSGEGRDLQAAGQDRGHAAARLGTFTLSDYDSGKIGSAAWKDAALDGDGKPRGAPFHLQLAGFDVKSVDLRPLLEQVRRSGYAQRGQFRTVGYESGDLSGMALDVSGGPHLGMEELHASQSVTDAGSTGKGSLRGLTLALGQMTPPPQAAPALTAFGARAVTLDVDVATHTTAADRRTTLHEDLTLRDLGKLHVDAAVSGYDAPLYNQDDPMATVLDTTLESATFAYEDGSLVNRCIAAAAAQAHTTPDLIRAQLAMPLVALGLMIPEQPDAADQVTAFLNHPGTLTVTLNPPRKVTLAEVAKAPVPARAAMLGLHVTAK